MRGYSIATTSLFAILFSGVNANQECVDSIGSHPICLFGQRCDCVDLTSNDPCGSEIASAMGNVVVNDICSKTCGACGGGDPGEVFDRPAAAPCQDEISEHPLCLFARMCSCESDILPIYGCGGEIESNQGTVLVNNLCRESCDACDGGAVLAQAEAYPGNVTDNIPLGTVDGLNSNLKYSFMEDKVNFEITFPDGVAWVAFQFWGGDFKGITDGRLPLATSGFECLVADDDDNADPVSRVTCRGRRVRHLFTNHDALPGPMDALINRYSVSSCTAERALYQVDDTSKGQAPVPYCTYDPSDLTNSSLIISSSSGSELVFVTDVQAPEVVDMTDVDITHDATTGYYEATWSRSREYPLESDIGTSSVNCRWAVSPRGVSTWTEGGLQYHGSHTSKRWLTGKDMMFLDPIALEKFDTGYLEEINANTVLYSREQLQEKLNVFRADLQEITNNEEPAEEKATDDDEGSSGASDSTMVSFWPLVGAPIIVFVWLAQHTL